MRKNPALATTVVGIVVVHIAEVVDIAMSNHFPNNQRDSLNIPCTAGGIPAKLPVVLAACAYVPTGLP